MKYLKYIDKHVPSLEGKTYIVTGPTSGLGLLVTKQIVYKGGKVIMACRNLKKGELVKEQILNEFSNAKLDIVQYDQANFASIDNFVNKIKDLKIDGILLNAGIYHPKKGLKTVDGYPLTIGTNYIGEYHLVNRLDSMLKNGSIKRLVFVSSLVHVFGKTKHYKKYLLDVTNKGNRTYNISKEMIYNFAANTKLKYPSLEVALSHPGITRTGIVNEEHSSFGKVFQFAADKFLKIFANHTEKAAIPGLIALTTELKNDLEYYYPRGLFHINGFPKRSVLNVKKTSSKLLDESSKKYLTIS